jgi:hypothetical protein
MKWCGGLTKTIWASSGPLPTCSENVFLPYTPRRASGADGGRGLDAKNYGFCPPGKAARDFRAQFVSR